MKIAIIGSGISGNTVAHYLHPQHDITLYEANSHVGGHTHTHDLQTDDGPLAIDTGFIVFNSRTYPNFINLLQQLGVDWQDTEMSFSVKDQAGGLEYNGHNLDTLFCQRRNLLKPAFLKMISDILRFNRQAPASLDNDRSDMPLGDYLATHNYGKLFIHRYIIPMGAAIWSTSPQRMMDFPAKFFIRFFVNHGLLQVRDRPPWYVIRNGSKAYVDKLIAPFKNNIHLNTPVEAVHRVGRQVLVKPRNRDAVMYDAVFIASHSDQALRMRGTQASSLEKQLLGSIPYQRNTAVLHTDSSLLPDNKKAWAAWNYHINAKPDSAVALTYYMNRLQSLNTSQTYCVTLNNDEAIDQRKIIKCIDYHHPVFTPDSVITQQRQSEINTDGIYYCGAYWRNGFHEDGVVSALNAIEDFSRNSHAQLHLSRAS